MRTYCIAQGTLSMLCGNLNGKGMKEKNIYVDIYVYIYIYMYIRMNQFSRSIMSNSL